MKAELVSGAHVAPLRARCECADWETQRRACWGRPLPPAPAPSLVQHSDLKPEGGGRHLPDSAQPPPSWLPSLPCQFCVYFQVLSRPEVLRHLYKPGAGRWRLGEAAGKGPKKDRAQMPIEAPCGPGTRVGAGLAPSPAVWDLATLFSELARSQGAAPWLPPRTWGT